MKIRVLLFAALRERAGVRELVVDVADDATAAQVREAVAVACPPLRPLLPNAALAVNEEYAAPEAPVRAGDAVALIPPVSGG